MGKNKTISSLEDLGKFYGLKVDKKETNKNSYTLVEEKKTKYVENTPLKRNNSIEKSKNKEVKSSSTKASNSFKSNNYNKTKQSPTTPYNFVPLNDVVLHPPLYEYVKGYTDNEGMQKGYKEFLLADKKYSGYCEVDIENITPLYIAGEDKKFFSDGKNLCIPGSSLRGCLKNIFKIITNGTMRVDKENPDITDKILYFRNLAGKKVDPTKKLYSDRFTYDKTYKDKDGNLKTKKASIAKAGFLVREGKQYYICRAELKVKKGDKWKVNPKAPCIKWYNEGADISTGYMNNKKHYYQIISPVWKDKYIIPDDILNGYRDDKNRKGLDLLNVDNYKKGTDREQFLKGAEKFDYIVPCFYVEENGIVSHFGAGPYYRIPYRESIGDHVPRALKEEQIDFADAIFGNKECWSSRIFVEDCYLDNDKSVLEKENYAKILMGPNPTSFQFYLNTDEYKNPQHWDSETDIRGYKFYWHKKMDWQGVKNDNENMNNVIAPVKANNHFKGKIRFENLDAIELGAFMYLFGIAEEEDICYKLGMGKSIGLGSIKLTGKFYFRDDTYYKKLFATDKKGFAKCLIEVDKQKFIDEFKSYIKNKLSAKSFVLYKQKIKDLKDILSTKYMMGLNSEKWNNMTRYMELGNKEDRNLVTSRVPLPTIEEVIQGLK